MIGFLFKCGLLYGALHWMGFWDWALEGEKHGWLSFMGVICFVYTFAWWGKAVSN
jgi:hypothetical protein